ncbi:MAG: DUF262 domain-containing protein [Dehalococcoidia bacterium]
MTLDDEITASRSTIHSDGYQMSIGELLNVYRDRELDIHPEFQRFFRWTQTQKSRLIESVLLGIPLPSIFVSQRADGVWDVIDGVQRLSTLFQFAGVLRDENEQLLPPLTLSATRYLPSLESTVWDEEAANSIGPTNQLLIKRGKIDVKIILKESDEQSKYELFQRLNTGGSPLTDQELRNCLVITVSPDFYHWIDDLADYAPFQRTISLSERLSEEQYDMELAVRFLVFRNLPEEDLQRVGDIGEFLTEKIVELATSDSFDRQREEEAFKRTFDYLDTAIGSDAFRRFAPARDRFLGSFLLSAFEFVALGIGHNSDSYSATTNPERVVAEAQRAWQDEAFLSHVGSGVRASSRIPVIIPLGRARFH